MKNEDSRHKQLMIVCCLEIRGVDCLPISYAMRIGPIAALDLIFRFLSFIVLSLGKAIEAIVGFTGQLNAAMPDSSGGQPAEGGVTSLRNLPAGKQDNACDGSDRANTGKDKGEIETPAGLTDAFLQDEGFGLVRVWIDAVGHGGYLDERRF